MDYVDLIRKARNVGELSDVVAKIGEAVAKRNKAIRNFMVSISANENLVIDHRDADEAFSPTRGGYEIDVSKLGDTGPILKNSSLFDSIVDNLRELDVASAMLRQSFGDNKNAAKALDSIEKLKADCQKQLDSVLDTVATYGEKHIPTVMRDLGDTIQEKLIDGLDASTYDGMFIHTYAFAPRNGTIGFAYYVEVENLKNESGFVFDNYFVTLRGIIDDDGVLRMELTSVPELKSPQSLPEGISVVTAKDVADELQHLLAFNHFITDFERQPLRVNTQRIISSGITSIKQVFDAEVKDDVLTILLNKNVKSDSAVQQVVTDVMLRLQGVLNVKKGQLKYKAYERVVKTVEFAVPRNVNLNKDHVAALSKIRGVSVVTANPGTGVVSFVLATAASRTSADSILNNVGAELASLYDAQAKLKAPRKPIKPTSDTEDRRKAIDFILVNRDGTNINIAKLNEVAKELKLTEREVKAFKYALQHKK